MTPRALLLVALLGLAVLACDRKPTHENIDKWMQTEHGPGKLKAALVNGSIDPDLSAHAAENLMLIGDDTAVREGFEDLEGARRVAVLTALAPRLWRIARIEGELTAPGQAQTAAKDLLVDLRAHADDATRATIDGYLLEWFTAGYYEKRAAFGRHGGAQVMRMLGPVAAPKMIAAANAVVGAPDKDGRKLRIGDQLLLGLAVTGDPDAVKYVLDVLGMDRGDPTLPERATGALYLAYVQPPSGLFERADPAGIVPHVDALARIARDRDSTNRMVNDAVAVIGAAGPPHCLAPLTAMISQPHDDPRYLWVGANNALRCAGPDAIAAVAGALPEGGSYEHEAMEGGVVGEIARMSPKAQVLDAARALLGHGSWVARWVGAEVLGRAGTAEDASRLDALKGDKARLHGYWGDQSELPKSERKPEPTLGNRAVELAGKLRGAGAP